MCIVFSRTKSADAGATPKLTTSARESSSTPSFEDTPRARAVSPSKKSNPAATTIHQNAASKWWPKAMVMAMHPETRLRRVTILGICFLIILCGSFGQTG